MKEGRKAKDAEISDNFNREKLTSRQKLEIRKAARAEQARLKKIEALAERAKEIARDKQIAELAGRLEMLKAKAGYNPEEKPEEEETPQGSDDDTRSAHKMLQDMRWVYKNLKGRQKLKELVEGDDKQFVFMVKELMKIEAALLAAKIRKTGEEEGKGVNQNFFVVLKGLEDEKQITEMIDKTVDLKQISRATNPDGTEMTE